MHKFPILKDGVNEKLLAEARAKVDKWLDEFFDEGDLTKVDDLVQFEFGSATIQVTVNPWHSEDVLVKVFSYLADDVDGRRAAVDFMRLNAELPLGAFSLVFDNTVMLSCSIPGANLDKSELLGALQTVAAYADQYDDILKEYY
ncbi:MAG: YbjN domain-containing protein [Synergistaceae bacterium]|nr:YbjN domain-containing protein [Synergistota bacterium]NLM71711.1 YbjN domain-containing protein [Synergistaceae bacterium]